MRPAKRPWLLPLLAALIVIPYPYFPALRSPNEGSRLYQARAIVDDGTFALDGEIQRYGPMGDLSRSDRGYFPNKAPGISFFGAAVYWVARAFHGGDGSRVSNETLQYLLRLFCCELPTIALLIFLRRELWRWGRDDDGIAADLALAAYALGSLAYTYGLLYFGHQLTAVCLMGSFLAIEGSRRQSIERRRLGLVALAGLLAGTAVFVEYPGALAALPLGLYVLWVAARRWRSVLAFGLASLPPQLVLLWYHKVCFGSPFSIGYRNNVNAQFNQWTARGFVGVSLPTWEGFWGSLFGPGRGLFVFSPFLLLAFYGLAQVWKKRRDLEPPAILIAVLTVLYVLFAASFVFEGWGWTVGPRHITPLAAFLTPPAALALASLAKRSPAWLGLGIGLCVLSVIITSLATVTYPHYPEVFTNGFFEVTVPLLLAGYLPRNLLGMLLGAQTLGWVLFFAGWLFLVGWMVFKGVRTAVGRVAVGATVAAGLLLLSTLGRQDTAEKQQMLQFVRQTYRAG